MENEKKIFKFFFDKFKRFEKISITTLMLKGDILLFSVIN